MAHFLVKEGRNTIGYLIIPTYGFIEGTDQFPIQKCAIKFYDKLTITIQEI
jgi:hypothetical protein